MIGGLILLRPWWLLALLAVAAATALLRRRKLGRDWAGVIDPALMPVIRRLGLIAKGRRDGALLLPVFAAAILSLALAGPAVMRPGMVEYRAMDPLLLVLDLSPSVAADDIVLGDLRAATARLLAASEGRPVGLMVYAADAYLASAPTSDADSLQGLIAVLDRDIMPVEGSRPDIALSMVPQMFGGKDGTGMGGADIVLISDGGGADLLAIEEATRLRDSGARIWALTLPRAAPGAPPPNPDALDRIARAGGGAAMPTDEVASMIARIAATRDIRLARDPALRAAWMDLGPWLMPFALLALLPLFRRLRG